MHSIIHQIVWVISDPAVATRYSCIDPLQAGDRLTGWNTNIQHALLPAAELSTDFAGTSSYELWDILGDRAGLYRILWVLGINILNALLFRGWNRNCDIYLAEVFPSPSYLSVLPLPQCSLGCGSYKVKTSQLNHQHDTYSNYSEYSNYSN